tara:strand:- start:2875 stop:3159 length:285 start_codon:yes stop_codon:yes gene_type:complete
MTEPNTNAGGSLDPEPITLFEFLDFEFHFEMAKYMGCKMGDLVNLRKSEAGHYKEAAMNVLRLVTPACRVYIAQKVVQQKEAREKLLATSAASQ